MSRYSYPRRQRVKNAGWRALNAVIAFSRAPFRSTALLLVTGQAPDEKIVEVEARLRFLFSHLDSIPEFHRTDRASLVAYFKNAAVVAVDARVVPDALRRHVGWVADLDFETNPMDGWALAELGAELTRSTLKKSIDAGRSIFSERVHAIRAAGDRPAYLFGTGPSLERAVDRSFDDGIAVVCNTIVRDADLWKKLDPAFFTAGDAIYHFGPTAHARAFRIDALQRLKESQGRTLFVYPAPFDVIVRSEFREIEELLVPIPWGPHTDVTVNLLDRFELPRLGNVLNALLLPLGCTLSREVGLWGFDGRAPTDTGFWSNSTKHAYPELMQTIRDAHPAFFADLVPKGKEVQYVNQVHGDLLDERLTDAEGRGFSFRMLHPSWTATLQKRTV